MVDFVNYQIKELLKRDNQCHYREKDIDMQFVRYCEEYIVHYKKLNIDLYNHLNFLFWKYEED